MLPHRLKLAQMTNRAAFATHQLPIYRAHVLPAQLYRSRRFLSSDPSKGPLVSKPADPAAPDLHVRWFYATDCPVSMPVHYNYVQEGEPVKFTPFSIYDSKRLEVEYQKLCDGAQFQNEISVNEDFLFEVDLQKREMRPVYWEGAVYEVRRGSWFTTEGNPVNEALAEELERGYVRMRPYEKAKGDKKNPMLKKIGSDPIDDIYVIQGEQKVVYSDDKMAYLLEKGYGGKLQVGYLKAVKNLPSIGAKMIVRGFEHPELQKQSEATDITSKIGSLSDMMTLELNELFGEKSGKLSEKDQEDNTKEAMKLELEQDYKEEDDDKSGERQVDHLIFCIHGIGQMLGTKFQAVNFTHTVNVMRKNLKKVYSENKEFQQLMNSKDDNCRIQVLPITWRHKVDFSTDKRIDNRLPSLADITVDEFKPMRNLLGSVLFDILLYYEPMYLDQILNEVVSEANRQYTLFRERNPSFTGKVSLVGHSLGSAIALDILAMQGESCDAAKKLDFKVENYFGMGSPVGAFNVLKRTNIGPRSIKGESTKECKTLACDNYYNIFHPCDPIGYRVEPLIMPAFKDYQPESVPYLIEDFNKQLSNWAQFGDSLTKKVQEKATSAWANYVGAVNITSLMKKSQQEADEKKKEKEEEVVIRSKELSPEELEMMSAMNYSGRVDYALQQGYLEFSIVSGVTAHMSYFEDENVAAFLLKETLTKHDKVKSKKVNVLG